MSRSLSALEESLTQIPGCRISTIVSRRNGLTLFRAGTIESFDVDKLNREVSKLFSSSFSNPYGNAWELPNVGWVYLKFGSDKMVYAVPVSEDHFWSVLVVENHHPRAQKERIEAYAPSVATAFEEARSR